jgi:hypothetical protein
MELYPQVRQVGGSILIDGENRTRANDDDPPGFKPSFLLAQDLYSRATSLADPSVLLDQIAEAIKDARLCEENQKDPMTRDPDNADCRPVMSIDEDGNLSIEWKR